MWVQSLGREDSLEKEMATHSSILACRIPMDRETWWATAHGVPKCQTQLSVHTHTHIQCCLEQIFRIIFLLYFYSEIQLVFYTSSIPVSSEVQYCSLGRKQNVHF